MKKWFAGVLAISILMLSGNLSETYAQKGKSYSSSSSSSGRSSFSSSSSSGKSYSSSPKPSSTPKPSTPKPVGKSYSSSSSTPKPSTPTPPSTTTSKPVGRSYSTNNTSTSSSKPTNSWNNNLTDSAKKEESRKNYIAATRPAETPKPTYRTSTGVEKPLKADSPDVVTVRKYVTHERYVTYDNRSSVFYGSHYRPEPFNDYFHPFLMGMLFSEMWNSHQRALWVYHHYDPARPDVSISEERYRELLRRDAKLQAELETLKAQKLARDPSYIPPQYAENPDLMYDKEFVNSSYNPEPVPSESSGIGTFLLWTFVVIVIGSVILMIVYYGFLRDYP